jgi:hypothetical protein
MKEIEMIESSTYAEIAHLIDEERSFVFLIEDSFVKTEEFIVQPDSFFPLLYKSMEIEPEKTLRIEMELDEVQRLFAEEIEELPQMVYISNGMFEGAIPLSRIRKMADSA